MNETFMHFLKILVLSLSVSSISMTTAKSPIFEGFRSLIERISTWLGKLVNCPYCTSHWLSLLAVILYRPVLFEQSRFIDYIVAVFAIVTLSSFWSGLIYRAFKTME